MSDKRLRQEQDDAQAREAAEAIEGCLTREKALRRLRQRAAEAAMTAVRQRQDAEPPRVFEAAYTDEMAALCNGLAIIEARHETPWSQEE